MVKISFENNCYYNQYRTQVLELVKLISNNQHKYSAMLSAKGRKAQPNVISKPRKLYAWINEVLPNIAKNLSVKEKCYWILNGLTDFPICQTCSLKLSSKQFRGINVGYFQFCCFKCYAQSEKFKTSMKAARKRALEANPNYLKEAAEKAKMTRLARYGAYESLETHEKRKQIVAKHLKDDPGFYVKIWQKAQQTNVVNGHPPTWHNQEQARKTRFKRNNGKWNSEHTLAVRRRNSILKYGVDDPTKSDIVRRHYIDTIRKKYGVDSYTQTPMFKQRMLEIDEQRKAKEHVTKFRNNSFNRSKPEDECYWILKFVYPHIIRQYRSAEYPFSCDFYDPDSKTYFEFNGSWTHGGHFFNPENAEDYAKLIKWKAKGTKFYQNAVQTWTVRDIKKKTTAEENRLKYVVFWNIGEAYDWVLNFNAC